MGGASKRSTLFRVTAMVVAAVVGASSLALLAALTGGAILAPLAFVALFAPLLAIQYLLWGRYLNRTLLDDGPPLDEPDPDASVEPPGP